MRRFVSQEEYVTFAKSMTHRIAGALGIDDRTETAAPQGRQTPIDQKTTTRS
jgi:hypothetical protein